MPNLVYNVGMPSSGHGFGARTATNNWQNANPSMQYGSSDDTI
jgi:hypothetical protein